jgi:hypothetical protein
MEEVATILCVHITLSQVVIIVILIVFIPYI